MILCLRQTNIFSAFFLDNIRVISVIFLEIIPQKNLRYIQIHINFSKHNAMCTELNIHVLQHILPISVNRWDRKCLTNLIPLMAFICWLGNWLVKKFPTFFKPKNISSALTTAMLVLITIFMCN